MVSFLGLLCFSIKRNSVLAIPAADWVLFIHMFHKHLVKEELHTKSDLCKDNTFCLWGFTLELLATERDKQSKKIWIKYELHSRVRPIAIKIVFLVF